MPARRTPSSQNVVVWLSVLCAHALAQASLAQIPTGQEFGGIVLPAPVQEADVALRATRAWFWRQGPTQRFLLEDGVDVRIGGERFLASRASVWLEPVRGAGRETWQIAVYFDTVENPAGDARVSQRARRLLVTSIVAGDVSIQPGILQQSQPPATQHEFANESTQRFGAYLAEVQASDEQPPTPARPSARVVMREDLIPILRPEQIDPSAQLPIVTQPEPLFASGGIVTFFGPNRTLIAGDDESTLVITGGVSVQYQQPETGRALQLTADSAVLFLDPGSLGEIASFDVEHVRGIYLEGGVVASDGEYSMRGPRFYYNLRTNKGVGVDAVFWTYDQSRGMPLYVRADVIRQEAENQWRAGEATLANSAFFEPRFTIGTRAVTITSTTREDDSNRVDVDARGVSWRAGGVPILGTSRLRGQFADQRLPKVNVTSRDGNPIVYTRWDASAMLGFDLNEGVEMDILLDGYVDRGVAPGLDARWNLEESSGMLFGSYIYDEGRDSLSSGAEIDRDGEHRGIALFENRRQLDEYWTLFTEGAYLSDPAFADAFFSSMAETRREFTNSASLRRVDERAITQLTLTTPSNDFIANEWLLQSRGYQTQRLPEISHSVLNTRLFDGQLLLSEEYRAGVVGLSFSEATAAEHGFDTIARAQAALGLLPGQSPADRLAALGLDEDQVFRADTRQEISVPMKAGALHIEPFGVGRLTYYSDDYSTFRTSGVDDKHRLWGGGGVRVSTAFYHIDETVESQAFDLRQMRHIIEPSFTLFSSATNLERGDLPIYDERVEGILHGTIWRGGITNTWQTKRGVGPSQRTIDWLTIRTDYVWSSDETPRTSPIGRFNEARPELSQAGTFVSGDAVLRLTDAVAITADTVYDTEVNSTATMATGLILDHGLGFMSYIESRDVDPLGANFLHLGASYDIDEKYRIDASAVLDNDDGTFQFVRAELTRRSAQLITEFGVDYDDIRNDTTFSVTFRPVGTRRARPKPLLFNMERDTLDLRSTSFPRRDLPGL
ncbi:MAG: hypothetical protein ACF8GE_03610 [Phycisphaerales bacterium JB043]